MSKIVKKVSYKDLRVIGARDNGEALIPVNRFDESILYGYEGREKPNYLSDQIMVRETVSKKLALANTELQKSHPNLSLKVTYGYRPTEIQKEYFNSVSRSIKFSGRSYKNEDDFLEEVHTYIAVPGVAGHPVGGAVDITIYDRQAQKDLDMGSEIDDFNDDNISWTTKGLTKKQEFNRRLLLSVMTFAGFAPFWGEWWHYSYGDKEWAAYYGKKKAIYDCIPLSAATCWQGD